MRWRRFVEAAAGVGLLAHLHDGAFAIGVELNGVLTELASLVAMQEEYKLQCNPNTFRTFHSPSVRQTARTETPAVHNTDTAPSCRPSVHQSQPPSSPHCRLRCRHHSQTAPPPDGTSTTASDPPENASRTAHSTENGNRPTAASTPDATSAAPCTKGCQIVIVKKENRLLISITLFIVYLQPVTYSKIVGIQLITFNYYYLLSIDKTFSK